MSVVVVAALLAVVALVQAWGMTRFPAPIDDEGTYMAQAWAVQVHHRLAHYTYWYDHPPLGWMVLALWGWVRRPLRYAGASIDSGRQAMLAVGLVSSGLLYVLARRLGLRRWAAAAAVLLFAASPLAVPYHRMVLLDNLAVPWLLAAFGLALSPQRRLWAAAGSGLCFAAAVLSKETVLVLLPILALQLWAHGDRHTRRFALTAFLAAFVLVGGIYPLYAALKGELLPGAGHVSLLGAVHFQLAGRAGTGSPLRPGTIGHATVAGWLRQDRWLVPVAVALVPAALLVRRLRWIGAALALDTLLVLRPGYLPDPFVVAALPIAALVVAGVADALWGGRVALPAGQGPRVRRTTALVAGRAAVAGGAGLALVLAGPAWANGLETARTVDRTRPFRQAERWIEANVPRTSRLLIDDSMWVDLVHYGFGSRNGVVWFYKVDTANNLDPSVSRGLPNGWRDIGYVVSTPPMRAGLAALPVALVTVRQAIQHSAVLARFGAGPSRIEVRRVLTDGAATP